MLIPFIDEDLMVSALSQVDHCNALSQEERARNLLGREQTFWPAKRWVGSGRVGSAFPWTGRSMMARYSLLSNGLIPSPLLLSPVPRIRPPQAAGAVARRWGRSCTHCTATARAR